MDANVLTLLGAQILHLDPTNLDHQQKVLAVVLAGSLLNENNFGRAQVSQRLQQERRLLGNHWGLSTDCSAEDFLRLHRVSSNVFFRVLENIEKKMPRNLSKPRRWDSVTIAEALSFTLRRLGSKGEAAVIAETYGRAPSTLSKWMPVIMDAIVTEFGNVIKWPTAGELHYLVGKAVMPQTWGAVDGKIFRVSKASADPISCKSHKGGFGVNVLVWADHDTKIRHLGRIYGACNNDARLYHESEMAAMETDGRWPPIGAPTKVIDGLDVPVLTLADGVFPHTSYTCKRFSSQARTRYTDRMRLYDIVQSASRVVIERTFGVLVARFRVFRGTFETNQKDWPQLFELMLRAACILHNLALEERCPVIDEGELTLYVESADAPRLIIRVEGDDTVDAVLDIIAMQGVDVSGCRLVFQDRTLTGYFTLTQSGVKNNATLVLVYNESQDDESPEQLFEPHASGIRAALLEDVDKTFRLVMRGRRVTFERN